MFQASRESLKYTVFASVSIQCGQKSITGIILRADNDGLINSITKIIDLLLGFLSFFKIEAKQVP